MTTKLFDPKRVGKFFNILYKLNRCVDKKYEDKCEKEVFVRRTVNKWLKGKFLILYDMSEQTELLYKKYIHISSVSLNLDWTLGTLSVNIYDYTRPMDVFNSITVDHNKALSMEGEWIDNPGEHHFKIIELTSMNNVPEKEYVFETYDWERYPKNSKKRKDRILEEIKGTISFTAQTELDAYRQKNKYKSPEGTRIIITELLEVKEL